MPTLFDERVPCAVATVEPSAAPLPANLFVERGANQWSVRFEATGSDVLLSAPIRLWVWDAVAEKWGEIDAGDFGSGGIAVRDGKFWQSMIRAAVEGVALHVQAAIIDFPGNISGSVGTIKGGT